VSISKWTYVLTGLSVFTLFVACTNKNAEKTVTTPLSATVNGPIKIEIAVEPSVKSASEKAMPTAKFAYYVVKGTEPKIDADLSRRPLFVCCTVMLDDVVPVVEAAIPTLKIPLFAKVQTYTVSASISNSKNTPSVPCAWLTADHLTYKGKRIPFTGKDLYFCSYATESQISARAISDMQATGNGVVVLPRELRVTPSDFVEIVFK